MATDRRWVVFDTSVYIAAIRAGLSSSLSRSYLCSVVSAELRAGTTSDLGRRVVARFTLWAQRVGRVVTPSAAAWERAGDVLGELRFREPELRSKAATLWNDLLIALSTRQIGATLVTADVHDFALIRRYLRFDLEVVSGR